MSKRSSGKVTKLVAMLDRLALVASKLSVQSKSVLTRIVNKHTKEFFDSEAFSELVYDIIDALPRLSPKRWADEARSIIYEPVNVEGIVRTAPPELITLWETMPSTTRMQVEQQVRRSAPWRSAIEFLRHLIASLKKLNPESRDGRRPAIERQFGHRVARIWWGLGLHVGNAYNGVNDRHIESTFQRFCGAALAAVGDKSSISERQVLKLKSTLRPKMQQRR